MDVSKGSSGGFLGIRSDDSSGGYMGTLSGDPWSPVKKTEGRHEKATHRLSPSPEPPSNKRHELCPVCGDGTTPGAASLGLAPPGAPPRMPSAARALDFSSGTLVESQVQESAISQAGSAEGVFLSGLPAVGPAVAGPGGKGRVHQGPTPMRESEGEGERLASPKGQPGSRTGGAAEAQQRLSRGSSGSPGVLSPGAVADTARAASAGCTESTVYVGGAQGQGTKGVCRGGVGSCTPGEAPWDELPTDSLLHAFAGLSFLDLHACVRVSRRWRQVILNDEELLANAPITRKAKPLPCAFDLKPPPLASSPSPASSSSSSSSWFSSFSSSVSPSDSSAGGPPPAVRSLQWMHPSLRFKICYRHIPVLLIQAAEAGNVAAMVWYADLLDAQGGGGSHQRKALEWRKKAARRGHQVRYRAGRSLYSHRVLIPTVCLFPLCAYSHSVLVPPVCLFPLGAYSCLLFLQACQDPPPSAYSCLLFLPGALAGVPVPGGHGLLPGGWGAHA